MPRKFGQHFLHRQDLLDRIAVAACPEREPLVVEIGPGRGALTIRLLERTGRLIAIEVDRALIDRLRQRFANTGRFELLQADVLRTDLAQWGPAVVAGNLPYYISSPILTKVLVLGAFLRRAVFLVQKEVADRLSAGPGSRDYGYLSVQTQLYTVPRTLFRVPPSAFRPPPKVDSAVVLLEPRCEPLVADPNAFLGFASTCFRHKRKTLRNNLSALFPGIGKAPEAGLRAEQLSPAQLIDLHQRLAGR